MFDEIIRVNNLLLLDIIVFLFLMLFLGVFVFLVFNVKCLLLELKIMDLLESILVIIVGIFEDVCLILLWLLFMINKFFVVIRKKYVVKSVKMFLLIK